MDKKKFAHRLRLYIFQVLTTKQQRKLLNLGYSPLFIEEISIDDFKKITKNKQLLEDLKRLKKLSIRLVG